ncbi:MAG: LacI family DNA-binding transcriptional regulator [Planctomycetota bacterium]|nr:LacI family DNA-binding transcriptional regulator [Planctomycetota bacterium]
MPTITLKQIALKVGVTPMTVSSALSGKGRIAAETRERILRAAQDLGYRPNASARATRTGRFDCVGLLVSSDKQYSYTPDALLWGIQVTLEKSGNHLAMARLRSNFDGTEETLPKCLRERLVDGMLVNLTHHLPPHILDAVTASRIPAIWMNTRMSSDCVYPDDRATAREMTRRLIERGHRRIAWVNLSSGAEQPEDDRHYSEFDRMAGYLDAVSAAGLSPRIHQPARALPFDQWVPFARALFDGGAPPTAVMAYRNSTAQPVAACAMSLGRSVGRGKDLEILSFGEYPLNDECLGIRIAVVPFFEVGQAAARMLLNKVAQPGVPQPAQAVPFGLQES